MRVSAKFFASLGFAMMAIVNVASAERAPIVYAGRTPSSPAPSQPMASPPSSGDNSYGYSDMRSADPSGASIDYRRSQAQTPAEAPPPSQPFEVTPQPAPVTEVRSPAPTERPAWLEQERVGPPYEANGRWYVPTPEPGYEMTGIASWYGPQFHAQATSSGEPFDMDGISAAHPTLPIPSLVQVTNLENGREIIVRVNDRGPYVADRVIDLSRGAARVLGFEQTGTARVHVRYLGPAPRLVSADGAPMAAAQPAPQAAMAQTGPTVLTPPAAPLVQSAPAQRTAAADGAFVVQVGAYSDLSNAQRVRAAVQGAGPANVDERQTARGTLYRVRVGPFASAADAEVAQLGYGESVVAAR